MSKVITFSRVFPAYHPKKGQPTYFVEKIWKGLSEINNSYDPSGGYQDEYDNHFHPMGEGLKNIHGFMPKHHTIRSGNRWKAGDKFSPRVWSGKPYNSKQIIIAPDIEIKNVFDITVDSIKNKLGDRLFQVRVNGSLFIEKTQYETLAKNDGLSESELLDWFYNPKQQFKGQIICWNENVNY